MEWIILSGSILVAAYFIYSVIQRSNDLNEKQLELKRSEVTNDPKRTTRLLSGIKSGLEDEIINAKFSLKEAQDSGDKNAIKKAKDNLEALKADYIKSTLAWFGAYQESKK